MPVRPPHPDLLRFLLAYDQPVVDLALAARRLVLREVPDAGEVISDACSAVAISFTFTGRWQDGFCHIATYSRHVNLGFDHGAHLPDPQKVLQGTGNQVRHIPMKTLADLDRPYLPGYPEVVINHQKAPSAQPPDRPTAACRPTRPTTWSLPA